MSARLAAGLEAAALIRRCEAEGGFASVLHRGDSERGSLLLLVAEKGRHFTALERRLTPDGTYCWTRVGPAPESEFPEIREFLSKRRKFDPDLWVLELDIPDAERFIAETND